VRLVPRTLRGRLALAAAAAAALAMTLVGLAVVATVAGSERRALDERLREQADGLRATALAAARLGLLEDATRQAAQVRLGPFDRLAGALLGGEDRTIRLVDGERVLLALGPASAAALPRPGAEGCADAELRGEEWRTCTAVVDGALRLQVASSLEPVRERVARVRLVAVSVAAAGVVGVGGLAWLLAGLALRPLLALRDGAGRVSGTQDLRQRLPAEGGPDEVAALARSLNEMLERLEGSSARTEAALQAARRFTADAGHELRTPLMALRTEVGTLRRADLPAEQREEVLAAVEGDALRLAALLEALQALARGDAGVGAPREPVDLAAVAAGAVSAARARHPEVDIRLEAEEAEVQGSADGLRMAVDNLLENAARHGRGGREGARVEVRVQATAGGGRVVVDDDGPGVAPEERARVLERFARGRDARAGGSGLGLAIVAQQAALHGGTVRLEGSPLGGARAVLEVATNSSPPASAPR
jgi:signal transduction histidine kinase